MRMTLPAFSVSKVLATAAAMSLVACGAFKKDEEKNYSLNDQEGIVVLNDKTFKDKEGVVKDTGVTLNRLRVWKRNPKSEFASHSSGEAPDFDQLTAEIWFKIDGEKQERYRKITGLRADSEGWLFPSESLGGLEPHIDNTNPYNTYQRTNAEGFVLNDTPFLIEYDRGTNIINDAGNGVVQSNIVQKLRFKFSNGKFEPKFGKIRNLALSPEANLLNSPTRTVWVKNERTAKGYKLTGKMACAIETRNGGSSGNGSFNETSVQVGDIELGEYIYNRSGDVQAAPGGANLAECTTSRCGTFEGKDATADDEIWVEYKESFQIVGLNISDDKASIQIVKTSYAPFYLNRELPTPQSKNVAEISGIERMVRSCNDAAVQNATSVAANTLLGTLEGGAPAPYSIIPTIGFRLIANSRMDEATANGVFVSQFMQSCEAMPDSLSPSAGLTLNYSAITKEQGAASTGINNCGVASGVTAALPSGIAGVALGSELDRYIATGTWSGEDSRHTGIMLEASKFAGDRPAFRQQWFGKSELKLK